MEATETIIFHVASGGWGYPPPDTRKPTATLGVRLGGALGAGDAGAGGCARLRWPAAGPLIVSQARLRRERIAKAVGDRAGEGAAYGNLGIAYQSLGDYVKAIEYHAQKLTIAKEVGDRAGEGEA